MKYQAEDVNKINNQEKCPRCKLALKWGKTRQGWFAECDLCGFYIEADYDPMDEGDPNEDVRERGDDI